MSMLIPKLLYQRATLKGAALPHQCFSSCRSLLKEEVQDHTVEKQAFNTVKGKMKPRKKTMAKLDEELMAKLAGMSDGGGEAGVEFENGKPVAMKQAVRSNMFRIMPFRGK